VEHLAGLHFKGRLLALNANIRKVTNALAYNTTALVTTKGFLTWTPQTILKMQFQAENAVFY
jgi:hypothetical protein